MTKGRRARSYTYSGLAGVVLTVALGSCGDPGSAAGPVRVATVSVTPASLGLMVSQTGALTAIPRDAAGNPLTDREVTWASENAAVATVTPTGLVTAVSPGTETVIATSEGQSGSATVIVVPVPVATVSVTPTSLDLTVGHTAQLHATPRDAHDTPLTDRVVTWASDNAAVATVTPAGLVTAVSPGTATVTATSEGQSGSASITVTPVPVASVSVVPTSLDLTVGQTDPLSAMPRDAAGNPLTDREVTWASENAAVATVTPTGLVTAVSAGTATVTATSEGQSGAATVTSRRRAKATVGQRR